MALVRQLTTAGFRSISKYEYIIPWLKVLIKPIFLFTSHFYNFLQ